VKQSWPVAVVGALRRPETYAGAARELTSLLLVGARYPSGLVSEQVRRRVAELDDTSAGPPGRRPVMLVHGFGHNRSGWWVMRRHLVEAGYERVDSFNYLAARHDVPASARLLAARVEQLKRATGADKVHLVGHSLGGILARWYVQELDGDASVDTVVTLGTPHEGTYTAYLGPLRTLAQLRPESWVMRRLRLGARPSSVRWVAFYSNLDELVSPVHSAMLCHPGLEAVNILVKDHGHLSLMLSPQVARAVADQLQAAEGAGGIAPLAGLVPGALPAPAPVEAGALSGLAGVAAAP
jgi:triacylglycerol lipase